jgi:hypothetical protein
MVAIATNQSADIRMDKAVKSMFANGRSDLDRACEVRDVLVFLMDQLRLRGLVGIRLSGESKDVRGYPDVVFGHGRTAYAVWVANTEFTPEARAMQEKMAYGWKVKKCGSKDDIMRMLIGNG